MASGLKDVTHLRIRPTERRGYLRRNQCQEVLLASLVFGPVEAAIVLGEKASLISSNKSTDAEVLTSSPSVDNFVAFREASSSAFSQLDLTSIAWVQLSRSKVMKST